VKHPVLEKLIVTSSQLPCLTVSIIQYRESVEIKPH